MNPKNESAPAQGADENTQRNSIKLSKRMHRLASALLERPHTVRELIDVIPTNNPAEYIKQLRSSYSLSIPCERIPFVTIDSMHSWHGEYYLTQTDREKVLNALKQSSDPSRLII